MIDERIKQVLEEEGLTDLTSTPLGGKRLRGVLTILVAEALGGKPEDALDAAVAVELAHSASLDADDIVDMDELRRGKPATWVTKGVVKAVIASHALVASSFNIVKKYGLEAVELFTTTYKRMVKGEIKDVVKGGFYEAIIAGKTAVLWSAAASLGAIAAGKREYKELAQDYGMATGMAFQIADDIVDVAELVEKGGITRVLKHPSSMAFIAYIGLDTILSRNPLTVISKGLSSLEEDMKRKAVEKLEEWVNKAKEYADKFPESEYKPLLKEFPDLAVRMMLEGVGKVGGSG